MYPDDPEAGGSVIPGHLRSRTITWPAGEGMYHIISIFTNRKRQKHNLIFTAKELQNHHQGPAVGRDHGDTTRDNSPSVFAYILRMTMYIVRISCHMYDIQTISRSSSAIVSFYQARYMQNNS